jgi:adenylate kinase family enzyme
MVEYEAKTSPLTDYYEKQGTVRHVAGVGSLDEVQARIVTAVGL